MKKTKSILLFTCALLISAFASLFVGNAIAEKAGHPENAVQYSLVALAAGAAVSYGMTRQTGVAFAAIAYTSLTGPAGGQKNMGGLKIKFYFASIWDFLSIKTLPAVPTTFANLAVITDTHTFNTGKCWRSCYITLDKGMLKYAASGELDGRSYKPEAEGILPGDDPTAMGLFNQGINDKFIGLFPMPSGRVIQIGTEDYPAELLGEFDSQKVSSGLKGYPFKFASFAPEMIQYAGTISLTPAS